MMLQRNGDNVRHGRERKKKFFGVSCVRATQKAKPFKIVFQHLPITALVITGSYLHREARAGLIAKSK
jgi:hypothetical protein